MAENTDLLPWLLGGMLALSAIAATAVGLSDSPPGSAAVPAATQSAAGLAQPTPVAQPGVPTDLAAQSAMQVSPLVVSQNARPQLPPGQVWECVIAGQRVFSDVQCGTHASVRQLNEINLIDSSTAYARSAPRPYSAGPDYYPQPVSDAPPDDSDADSPINTGPQIIVTRDRVRRDHLAHRGNHPHPRAARQ